MDVDTRLLRYAVAVAREGSLTRAAERLHVSQPALTKQIRRLETDLGVRLFTRSREGMTPTEAGRALVEGASPLLDAWERLLAETRRTATRTERILRVGFVASAANEATPAIIAAFARALPGWRVEMRQAAWSNPSAGLADGDVDAAFVRLPFPGQEDLRTHVLFSEPRCVALAAGHRLADRRELDFRELWDEPFVAAPAETGSWRDHWLATDEREGHPARVGAVTEHPDDWLSAIANGYGIALAPASAARFYARPGVVYRPVHGVSPTRLAIAWAPASDADPAVQAFVRCCRETGSSEDAARSSA
ncbi:LysR family transcriptional regulator [Streptomyces sp. NPDC004788]